MRTQACCVRRHSQFAVVRARRAAQELVSELLKTVFGLVKGANGAAEVG